MTPKRIIWAKDPIMKLPMGQRNAVLGGGNAVLSGWCTKVGVRGACGRSHWALRWNFPWCHETL
eukprot:89179-Pyramimonas_sp.AAC.1